MCPFGDREPVGVHTIKAVVSTEIWKKFNRFQLRLKQGITYCPRDCGSGWMVEGNIKVRRARE